MDDSQEEQSFGNPKVRRASSIKGIAAFRRKI